MERFDSYRIRLVVVGIVVATMLGGGNAKGDFTFGEPTNLGTELNTANIDSAPDVSADGLSLFFHSDRPGGYGGRDLWMTIRKTSEGNPEGYWSEPVNLGPIINSSARDAQPNLFSDGLSLFFQSDRPGGSGGHDIWVTTRVTTEDDWGIPVNLGPTVNSSAADVGPSISADRLSLFFDSTRSGGSGDHNIWVTTRATTEDDWSTPVNLGPVVNSPDRDGQPSISADGLLLFFHSNRPGGSGDQDLWVSRRETINHPWEEPVNLGSTVNSSSGEWAPGISADGSTLYYASARPGGLGSLLDLWQVPLIPIVDLNSDATLDRVDIDIMLGFWGTDEPLCDIGPMPWGDGVVDVQDLIVLVEHMVDSATDSNDGR